MTFSPDSTQPGYLGPSTETLDGVSWEDFLHDVVAGVTGLPPPLVRPRWQPQPPTTPAVNIDWVAFGVMRTEADFEPWINHYGTDPAHDLLQRMERVTVLCSFYGPDAQEIAGVLRDGLYVDQNRAAFRANGVGIIEIEEIVRTAELFREQFRERSDLNVILRREVRRSYNVLNLVRARGPITGNDFGSGTVTTEYDTGTIPTIWDGGATTWDGGSTRWDEFATDDDGLANDLAD